MRFFNTTGPIRPSEHYFIPNRLDWSEVLGLIERSQYFVIYAPRQVGKTTAIEELVRHLNQDSQYCALYINIEPAQAARDNVKEALIAILAEFKTSLQNQLVGEEATIQFIEQILSLPHLVNLNTLIEALSFWAKASPIPRVLFIDEIDALIGDSLLSVLRQIRRGFGMRPNNFPQSLCLIGLRDVRDYRVWSKESGVYVSTSSPFNIKAVSILLPNFSPQQVAELYDQHTREMGQVFEKEAVEYAFYLTQGQPWLVNALAFEAAFVNVKDRQEPITKETIEKAKEQLIIRQDTHIDSLLDKLNEPRVLGIIDAIISGKSEISTFDLDDVRYVYDLGLIKKDGFEIANPIYKEIIPRALTSLLQKMIPDTSAWYLDEKGNLDMSKLLAAFTAFFREHSGAWGEKIAYHESMPHLLLMAFLQRIINGCGSIAREYALGQKRVDLYVTWKKQIFVIELKIKYGEDTLQKGLVQISKYIDYCGATEGHLLIVDRDPGKSWDEKISQEILAFDAKTIHVWTM